MVDTTLRPRPAFGTFLQSDNSMKDGLSYYEYQRLVRSKKVALLQERRERTYEPGYKKSSHYSDGPISRKVFEFKKKDYFDVKTAPREESDIDTHAIDKSMVNLTSSKAQLSPLHIPQESAGVEKPSIVKNKVGVSSQSDRLPRIKQKVRMVKSATAREYRSATPQCKTERPKSVCSSQDISKSSLSAFGRGDVECQTELLDRSKTPSLHRRAYTDDPAHLVDIEDAGQSDVDALARAYTWRTSSQRATDEIGWNERIPSPTVPAPASTIEQFPDPVSMKLTFRRYNSEPADWQSFGAEWDFVQTRPGSFIKGPQGMNYSSCCYKTQQIPGYYGHMSNFLGSEKPRYLVRSGKPRATNISRHANIPGYTGCVHWTSVAHAHSNTTLPEPTTSARTHRHIPLEEDQSPFSRTGVFAKMVKTVSPYNPYNKIDP